VEQLAVHQHFPEELNEDQNRKHQDLAGLLVQLYRFFCERDSAFIRLNKEALRLFQQERKRLNDLKNETLSDAARSIFNKCHGRIGRLAGLFHIL
jgi:hypothetical protein